MSGRLLGMQDLTMQKRLLFRTLRKDLILPPSPIKVKAKPKTLGVQMTVVLFLKSFSWPGVILIHVAWDHPANGESSQLYPGVEAARDLLGQSGFTHLNQTTGTRRNNPLPLAWKWMEAIRATTSATIEG